MHTKVPLWLALNLKQRHKCRIECPHWLDVGKHSELVYTPITLIKALRAKRGLGGVE